jgi:hypothetical protein
MLLLGRAKGKVVQADPPLVEARIVSGSTKLVKSLESLPFHSDSGPAGLLIDA